MMHVLYVPHALSQPCVLYYAQKTLNNIAVTQLSYIESIALLLHM